MSTIFVHNSKQETTLFGAPCRKIKWGASSISTNVLYVLFVSCWSRNVIWEQNILEMWRVFISDNNFDITRAWGMFYQILSKYLVTIYLIQKNAFVWEIFFVPFLNIFLVFQVCRRSDGGCVSTGLM